MICGISGIKRDYFQPFARKIHSAKSGGAGEINPPNPAQSRTASPTLTSLAKQIADCEAKSTFRSKGDALRFIDRSGYPLAPYRCAVCGEWHLTKEGKV